MSQKCKCAPALAKEGSVQCVEKAHAAEMTMKCSECAHDYDPMKYCGGQAVPAEGCGGGAPFEQLPDVWDCPVCGQGKDMYAPAVTKDDLDAKLLIEQGLDVKSETPKHLVSKVEPKVLGDDEHRDADDKMVRAASLYALLTEMGHHKSAAEIAAQFDVAKYVQDVELGLHASLAEAVSSREALNPG